MYKWFLAAAAVCLMGTSAVAAAEDSYYLELPTKGITSSRKISVNVPDENPVIDGINPLTGESWYGNYYPILVNIDAHPEALPHWGVASADISYEMPVQGDGSTRSAMLFMGTIPSFAGPVRSARVPMGSLREIWDSAWVFYGWQNWANGNNIVVDVDDWALSVHSDARQKGRWVFPFVEGSERNYSDLFHRENDGEHVAPHNVQINMNAVASLFTSESTKHPFKFTEIGLDRGVDVSAITINYKTTNPAYVSSYEYNEMTGLYERYRNGAPYYDALTGAQTEYANVIVLRTDVSWFNNAPQRPVIQLVGQGVAEIFQNGKYIRGTWVRTHDGKTGDDAKSLPARMIFFDENGEELEMKVGKTFIQIVNNDQAVIVNAGEQIEGATAQATPAPTATPKPTRTPKASANATPAPVEGEDNADEDVSFGG